MLKKIKMDKLEKLKLNFINMTIDTQQRFKAILMANIKGITRQSIIEIIVLLMKIYKINKKEIK
jgi:hypothetical protein